jgi:hypothetical protein
MACIRCCLVTGSRDSLPVCARTRSYSYAFPYCGTVSHPYFPSTHRGQGRYHVKNVISSLCCTESNSRMIINNDFEKMCKKLVVDNTEVLPPNICLGRMRKAVKNRLLFVEAWVRSHSVCGLLDKVALSQISLPVFLRSLLFHHCSSVTLKIP